MDSFKIGASVEFRLAKGVYLVVDMKHFKDIQLVKLIPASMYCDVKEEFWVSQNLISHKS
jgi:hypothetical protein